VFDLNEQISKWRSNLAQSQTLGKPDIDELESHLQEEIENLTVLKLSGEEAFMVATHRLGGMDMIASEYAKINCGKRLKRNVSWMITGILVYLLAMYFATAISKDCVLLAANNGITGDRSLGFIGFILKILTLITTFILGYFFCRLIPGLKKQIKQLTTRERLLIVMLLFLIITFVYRVFFHVPVPGFKPMSVKQCVEQALGYTTFLWSVFLPAVLGIVLIILTKSNLHEVE
jgi:hypothetical protein